MPHTSTPIFVRILTISLSLVAVFFVSACTDDRVEQLSAVQVIDIPEADAGQQANQNIDNPTLFIPETFPVADGDELTLVWSEEFDGPEIDPQTWFFATGDGTEKDLPSGWGNNELQYYLPDNAMIVNGVLELTARRETVGDFDYTSARINTEDRFAFKYGRVEASIKLPSGQGLWPAFWMLSQDSDYECDANGRPCIWAATGEIDIVEAINLDGTNGNDIFATIHYGGEFPNDESTSVTYTPSEDVTEDFHTYAIEWDEFQIRWYFDGQLYAVQNSWDSAALGEDYPAPFNQNFHILLNVAVGGDFPRNPNGATPFPATMQVDWVRVYSGEEPFTAANPGIIPEDVIYATDPNETVDIATTITAFGTSSQFEGAYALDADFNPVFEARSGSGYGLDNIVQLGFVTNPQQPGFAAGYESFSFKIKSADLPGNTVVVKLEGGGGAYGDVVLTDTMVSTALGNGWYQVVLPMSGFTNVGDAVGILFERVGAQNADGGTPFSFLVTDIGFGGSVPADPGIVPDDVIYATDPNETVDIATTITAFGTSSQFEGAYALDADFNPVFEARSGSGYGLDNIVQLGFVTNPQQPGFAAGYESFSFKIKSADLPGNTVIVKLEGGGGAYGDVVLTDTTISTALGNGWYQVVLPMSGFTNVGDAVGILFERVGAQNADGGTPFSFLVTDIGFNDPVGGGGATGIVPDDVIYATDPNETVDIATTITAFGTSSQFEGMYMLDADFNPVFEARSGSGYGLDNIVQLGFVTDPQQPGFAAGYESFSFKIKSADLPGNTVIVKLEGGGGAYGDVVLTDTTISTALGNGWYQVVLPMSGFTNVADAVGILFEQVGAQNADGGTPFSFLVTDIGFNDPTGN